MTPAPYMTADRLGSFTPEPGRHPADLPKPTPKPLDEYDAFYRRHFNHVRRIATLKSGASVIGEDLATDVMVVMLEKWDDVRAGVIDNPDEYMYGVLRNRVRKHYERTFVQAHLLEKLFEPELSYESAERRAVINIEADNVMVMLKTALTQKQRKIFLCRYVLNMRAPEIAKFMDMTPPAVRKTLRMATKKLQDRYEIHR